MNRFLSTYSTPKVLRVFGYRDFRLLWIGAFLSFTGSWVQNVAQGYFVYKLTGDERQLGLVSFANSVPVFVFGFLAGSVVDSFDKRRLMVLTQAFFALGSLYLAAATFWHFVSFWQILVVSFLLGVVSCVEMPARQSIVSRVVPPEDLAAAVPVNAMTFNFARVIGPAVGGFMLARFDVQACYLINGLSFLALIWAALAIQSDLTSRPREAQPIRDLIMEGALYTWREKRLRTLLILETVVALFGIFYIPLIPAYIHQVLGFSEVAAKPQIGMAYSVIGVGGMIGLLSMTALADSPHKGRIVRASMGTIGASLILLSFIRTPWLAYGVMGVVGGATIMQFNTTNALFQLLSPDRLRGRVISMHIWALNGLAPFGILGLANLSSVTRGFFFGPLEGGIMFAMFVGGLCVLMGWLYGLTQSGHLTDVHSSPAE